MIMSLSSTLGSSPRDENSTAVLPDQSYHSFQKVKEHGPPAQPLHFPKPIIHNAKFVKGTRAIDHRQGSVHRVDVLTRRSNYNYDRKKNNRVGYLMKKKIANTVYGCIHLCVILRQRKRFYQSGGEENAAEWISTDELVAIKASSWLKMKQMKGKHLEDPVKEAAASQFVGNYHPNILGSLETLQDSTNLYLVMPYCSGGTLYSHILNNTNERNCGRNHKNKKQPRAGRRRDAIIDRNRKAAAATTTKSSILDNIDEEEKEEDIPDETQARHWFRQLLNALVHLQQKGICHRDLCLENILLEDDSDKNLVIIDFGIALRVPYQDPNNYGGISDVSEGTSNRLLIKEQGQGGVFTYMDPVIYEGESSFDGYAADLWSAGVLLFTFLIGLAPFQMPSLTDHCFRQINQGKLAELLTRTNNNNHNVEKRIISNEACDLLQKMLLRDPYNRLTLAQIMEHPWVVGPSNKDKPNNNVATRTVTKFRHHKSKATSVTVSSSEIRTYTHQEGLNNELLQT